MNRSENLSLIRRFILGLKCGSLGGSIGGGLYGLSLAIITILYKGGADLGGILFGVVFLTTYGLVFGLIGGTIVGTVLGIVVGMPAVIKRGWVLIPISILGSAVGIVILQSVLAWPPLWPKNILQLLDLIAVIIAGGIGGAIGGSCYMKRGLQHLLNKQVDTM